MLMVPINSTDHVRGPVNAPITVVEYVDFECPYCRIAYGAVKIMLKRYENRVQFVFRHFPLVAWHSNAEMAAEAAEAAGAQQRFWPMHDLLFEHDGGLSASVFRQFALRLELDMKRYDFEMEGRVYLQRIREHQLGGMKSEVRSIPSFFVEGELQDVTFGMEFLDKAINRRLHPQPDEASRPNGAPVKNKES